MHLLWSRKNEMVGREGGGGGGGGLFTIVRE